MKDMHDIPYCYDEDTVLTGKQLISKNWSPDLNKVFKILADDNKAKIILILSKIQACCVCDISNILDISIANASHHLRHLYKLQILTQTKEGKMIFYALKSHHISQILTHHYTLLHTDTCEVQN